MTLYSSWSRGIEDSGQLLTGGCECQLVTANATKVHDDWEERKKVNTYGRMGKDDSLGQLAMPCRDSWVSRKRKEKVDRS